MYSILSDIRVLECASSVAGAYCGRLLADAGADVVKVERPFEGDPCRHEGPFAHDLPHSETSLLFQYGNVNKRSITLDTTTPRGADILTMLIATSDVVIEERPGGCVQQAALDYPALREANPRTVVLTISPYGQYGPKRNWKARPLTVEHASGMGWLNPTGLSSRLFPDRQPLMLGGHIGEYFVAFTGANAVMFGLLGRMTSGMGQHIDLSSQDALISLERASISYYANTNFLYARRTRDFPYGGCFPCADGYVEILAHEDHHWMGLAQMIEKPEYSSDPAFTVRESRVKRGTEINAAIEAWTHKHTRQEIYAQGVRYGLPVGMFKSPAEVTVSEHETSRGFFQTLSHPLAGVIERLPRSPFIMTPVDESPPRPAPLLGEHNEQVYCDSLGFSPSEMVALRQAGVV